MPEMTLRKAKNEEMRDQGSGLLGVTAGRPARDGVAESQRIYCVHCLHFTHSKPEQNGRRYAIAKGLTGSLAMGHRSCEGSELATAFRHCH